MALIARVVGRLPRGFLKAAARLQWRHPFLKVAFDRIARQVRGGEGIIAQGAGRGLRFNAGGSNAGYLLGTSEPGVQQVLARVLQHGMTVYDLGASVGFHAIIAARLVGPSGRVLCFEALAENAAALAHNAALNGFSWVQVEPVAVGAEDGEAAFLLGDHPNWGRVANAGDGAAASRRVPRRSLDSLVAEKALPAPDLIKMDVEGAEVDVLAGARGLLRSARPLLLIELHGTNAAIARGLSELEYEAHVLGGGGVALEQAYWNAHCVAFPREREDLRAHLPALVSPEINR